MFQYEKAFSRNIGWITKEEQELLRHKKVAIGGLGGVGGSHLITLARLGVGNFVISDLDDFELGNFNRQQGANMETLNRPKLDVMKEQVQNINPEANISCFPEGINFDNLDAFLEGADVYVDSLDIFCMDLRQELFKRCADKGITTITVAPMGMGAASLVFKPNTMSFEKFFCLEGLSLEEKVINFIVGVSPTAKQMEYLMDDSSVDLFNKKVPSLPMGIDISASVACSTVLKILLNRGQVVCAPHGLHFDSYQNRLTKTWRPFGNKNPLQRIVIWHLRKRFGVNKERKALFDLQHKASQAL